MISIVYNRRMNFQAYNKAIAALVVPLVLAGLGYFGITPDMPVGEAVQVLIGAAITTFFVWLVPNKN